MIRFLFAILVADDDIPSFFLNIVFPFDVSFHETCSLPAPLQVPRIYALTFSDSTRPGSFPSGELRNFSSCI